jgi:hypothetical protein
VAGELQRAGLATLLMDLLTPAEGRRTFGPARLRFDVGLLGERVIAATDWLAAEPSAASRNGIDITARYPELASRAALGTRARRRTLADTGYRLGGGSELLAASREQGLEGIIARRPQSTARSRSRSWACAPLYFLLANARDRFYYLDVGLGSFSSSSASNSCSPRSSTSASTCPCS